jgi:hypothetical protein
MCNVKLGVAINNAQTQEETLWCFPDAPSDGLQGCFLARFRRPSRQLRLLAGTASSLQKSPGATTATMGAENSKPSSEVKQHVFSSYVAFPALNGSCPSEEMKSRVTSCADNLRAEITPTASPMNSSDRCRRTLSYVSWLKWASWG